MIGVLISGVAVDRSRTVRAEMVVRRRDVGDRRTVNRGVVHDTVNGRLRRVTLERGVLVARVHVTPWSEANGRLLGSRPRLRVLNQGVAGREIAVEGVVALLIWLNHEAVPFFLRESREENRVAGVFAGQVVSATLSTLGLLA